MSIEVMKQALEALEKNFESLVSGVTHAMTVNAINAIREALADIGNPITEQLSIPTVITCPFCSSKHVPGWLHDYNIDRGAYGEQPTCKQSLQVWVIPNRKGGGQFSWEPEDERFWTRMQPAIKQDLTPEPAQQESLKDLWHKVWPDAGAFVRVSADDLTQFAKAVSTPPQPAQQEPVLWQILNGVCHAGVRSTENLAKEAAAGMQKTHDLGGSLAAFHIRPLYTSPPAQRKPLTDDRLEEMWEADTTSADDCKSLYYFKVVARAIEAAHGIIGDQK